MKTNTITEKITIVMSINKELNGVELRFSEKPSKDTCAELKANGFRFTNKGDDARWYAKQSDETLAYATTLVGTGAPKTTPKTEAKAEPKAKAPKQTKAKGKAKTEAKTEFKNAGRGDKKERYDILKKSGEKQTVRGYKFSCTLNGKTVQFGTHKEKDETWTVTDIKSGLAIGNYPKCYIAIASVNAEITGKVIEKMGY